MPDACCATDLEEPAAEPVAQARLHLGERVLFLGTLGQVANHVHATAVLVVGLYEDVGLRHAAQGTHPGKAARRSQSPAVWSTSCAPVAVFYLSHASLRAGTRTRCGHLSRNPALAALAAFHGLSPTADAPVYRAPEHPFPALPNLVPLADSHAR